MTTPKPFHLGHCHAPKPKHRVRSLMGSIYVALVPCGAIRREVVRECFIGFDEVLLAAAWEEKAGKPCAK